MTSNPDPDKAHLDEALGGLLDAAFSAFHDNVDHASRLFSESIENRADIDVFQELARFWSRAARDTGRLFQEGQEFLNKLGSSKGDVKPQLTPTSGPASAANPAAVCTDDPPVGPFRTPGAVQAVALRRRGDEAPSITSGITVTPANVTRDTTNLQIGVPCSGVARGLYEGTLMVGTDEYSYNVYLDPK